MKVTCDIINDLLPLYVDEVCSESSKQAVEEHIKKCEKCSETLNAMRGDEPQPGLDKSETEKAKKPFTKLKKRVIAWSCFGVVILSFIVTFGLWALEENGIMCEIRNTFYPDTWGFINKTEETDDWTTFTFEYQHYNELEVTDYFEYRTIFTEKEVLSYVGNGSDIEITILDEDGNTIIEPTIIKPGEKIPTESLKLNKKYTVQCKCEPGHYEICFQ